MVTPFVADNVQPASIDLTLASDIQVFERQEETVPMDQTQYMNPRTRTFYPVLDLANPLPKMGNFTIKDLIYLYPGDLIIASTVETVHLPHNVAGKVEGKSSRGRIGLSPIVGAGWIDPGFHGQVTLEIVNQNPYCRIVLRPGMKICQMTFLKLDYPAVKPYQGRFQNQTGATASIPDK
jgi:dCTP deaminase